MKTYPVRISGESDLIIDKFKSKARIKFHKKIPKARILDWFIQTCMPLPEAQKKFENWVKIQ